MRKPSLPPSEPNHDKDQVQIGQYVSNLNRAKEEEYAKKRAIELGLEYQDLFHYQPNPAAVVVVSKDLANSARIFAYDKTGSKVKLAIDNPTNPATVEGLKQLASLDEYEFSPVLVSESTMDYLLALYDVFAPTQKHQENITISQEKRDQFAKLSNLKNLQESLSTTSASEITENMFAGAIGMNASDIHIEPTKDNIRLRYRLDGVLQDIATLELTMLHSIIDRIKMTSGMKLNITEAAQDGRFSIAGPSGTYDIRVSLLPTQYGESAVMRLLPQEGHFISLDEIGFPAQVKQWVETAIHEPNGLILNTGPTGSGKTTTLYAILNTINAAGTKIITVEDPIEYRLQGITQTQVNAEEDYTFANALRAIVRQDPDIILVGEIRDQETAEIAVNAALTGHLVLSTLHTNDAAGSIPRLTDLGADPKLFADALRLIIAQRLVRRLCPKCKTAYTPTADELAKIADIDKTNTPAQLYKAVGCDECNNTGYSGRIGIFEVLRITPEIKAKINSGAGASEIKELALNQGMITLAQDGLARVIDGTTTLEELLRVAGEQETD